MKKFFFAIAIACLHWSVPVWGATFSHVLTIEEMAQQSATVIQGRVQALRYEWAPSGLWTIARVQIHQTLHGQASSWADVRWPGGKWNGMEQSVAGAPQLRVGDEAVWFVRPNQQVTAMTQGVFVPRDGLWVRAWQPGHDDETAPEIEAVTLQQLREWVRLQQKK